MSMVEEHTSEMEEMISRMNPKALLADGLEDAFVGMIERANGPSVACYDRGRIIEILQGDGDMSFDDAQEYFDFNILGAYVGDNTPVFLTSLADACPCCK
mgnify:FL=1